MKGLHLAALPASLFAATLALEIATLVLSWGLEPRYDSLLYALLAVSLAGAGALIASRHPDNPIGWLFCGLALQNALMADAAQGWGLRAAEQGWPGSTAGEWIALTSWLPNGLGWILAFLLFPDGALPSRRSRSVMWMGAVGVILALPGWSLDPDVGSEFVGGRNPLAVEWLPTDALYAVGMTLFLCAFVASVVALVSRFRRSTGVERQQLKWFVFATACAGVVLPLAAVLWNEAPIVRLFPALVLTALPIAACIAILRYRLYDIDVVINRTLVYGALTISLAAAYAASALLLGTAAGRSSAWATAGATLIVAIAFRPLRARLQDIVDRRFRRARYDALRRMAGFLEDLRAGRAAPEEVEGVLREALSDPRLELRFFLPESECYVDSLGRPGADVSDDRRERTPIERAGVPLGMVIHDPARQEHPETRSKVVEAAGLAIEIARLRVGLRRQLQEVEASRARIVSAGYDERRRIERDLHDGAQQRLVSIGLALRHAQHELRPDAAPDVTETLDGAVAELTVAINELRELARGLRPAQLEGGLAPALRELAGRAPLPVDVTATSERFAEAVETAAYFIACEGLTNAVKHARASRVVLSVTHDNGKVIVDVADDGIGGAAPSNGSGLTGLSDRVVAQGGTLRIESAHGHGTRLIAELPCAS